MKRTKITFNLKGLEDLQKQLGNTYVARVGILGSNAVRKQNDTPLNNAEIGLIQMFGSYSNNIPPRDFLLMPMERKHRELVQAMRSPAVKSAMEKGDYKKVFQILGEEAEKIIHEAFDTSGFGTWPANAPATIAAKGSSKPLIDTRQLERAISSEVVKKGSVAKEAISGVSTI